MTRQGYQYVVLRCVPRVDREEFLNVGVVVYCEEAAFLEAAWSVDRERLGTLIERLPDTIILSIDRRGVLRDFHARTIEMQVVAESAPRHHAGLAPMPA